MSQQARASYMHLISKANEGGYPENPCAAVPDILGHLIRLCGGCETVTRQSSAFSPFLGKRDKMNGCLPSLCYGEDCLSAYLAMII